MANRPDPTDPDLTDQVAAFYRSLGEPEMTRFEDALAKAIEVGPSLGRPVMGEISLLPDYKQFVGLFGNHLKELRPLGTDIRVLCIYSPARVLVLLVAGDKAGSWNRWYRTAIAEAAREYAAYLQREGFTR